MKSFLGSVLSAGMKIFRPVASAPAIVTAPFPFECVETSWDAAVSTWEQLKMAGRGFPVIIGNDSPLSVITDQLNDSRRTVEEILAIAATLRHPEGLIAERLREIRLSNAALRLALPEEGVSRRNIVASAWRMACGNARGDIRARPDGSVPELS
jgi:hypothetical protein